MAKPRIWYECSQCGAQSPKWQGKCFECGAFGSLVETVAAQSSAKKTNVAVVKTRRLDDVVSGKGEARLKTGMAAFDSVLGGGLVVGQVILLAGEPGVGKSTLLLQLCQKVSSAIYVNGEESDSQIKFRADRMGLFKQDLKLLSVFDIDVIESSVRDFISTENHENNTTKVVLIVDSIQSVFSADIKSAPGSIAQVQYCARKLVTLAKELAFSVVLVGQITKSGYVAGPKQLEHIVDTILYIEGDRKADLRLLRSIKNRFGPTGGVEVLQMTSKGLIDGEHVLATLIHDRKENPSGLVRAVILEGQRPILLEVEALNAPATFGNPRRVANGVSVNRLNMLLAVLQRRLGIKTYQYDVYVNVSGGFRVLDTGLDLPICLAVASAIKNIPVREGTVAFGEVGLLGEIRPAVFSERRIEHANKMGFTDVLGGKGKQSLREVVNLALKK